MKDKEINRKIRKVNRFLWRMAKHYMMENKNEIKKEIKRKNINRNEMRRKDMKERKEIRKIRRK